MTFLLVILILYLDKEKRQVNLMDHLEKHRQLLSATLENVIRRQVSCVADYLKAPKLVYYLVDPNLKKASEFFLEKYQAKNALEIDDFTHIDKYDVLFCISYNGTAQEIVDKAQQFKEQSTKITCITNNLNSALASLSQDTLGLSMPKREEINPDIYQEVFKQAVRTVLEDMDKKIEMSNRQ